MELSEDVKRKLSSQLGIAPADLEEILCKAGKELGPAPAGIRTLFLDFTCGIVDKVKAGSDYEAFKKAQNDEDREVERDRFCLGVIVAKFLLI